MGVELFFNEELTGENGYIEFQADTQGYQITSMPNVEKKEKNEITILFVSRLIEGKGLQYLIPDMKKIQDFNKRRCYKHLEKEAVPIIRIQGLSKSKSPMVESFPSLER